MLKKEEYFHGVKRPYPPLHVSWILKAYSTQKYFDPFMKNIPLINNLVHQNGTWHYPINKCEEIGKAIFNHWLNEYNFNQAVELFEKYEKDLMSNLNEDLKTFGEAYKSYVPAINLIWLVDKHLEQHVKGLLSQKLDTKETEELLSHLNIPLKNNFHKQEEYDLVTCKDINKHVEKYWWILSRYGNITPYTKEFALEKLSKINKGKWLEEHKEQKEIIKKSISKSKELIGNHLTNFYQFIVFYRTHRTDVLMKAVTLHYEKIKDNYEKIIYSIESEQDNLPNDSIILERKKGFTVVLDEQGINIYSGQEQQKYIDYFKYEQLELNSVKGQVASKGKVVGRAKIVGSYKEISKVENGDIIITAMTTPDMISAMEKAAGFVTDEGGITCHAAIISREMKKPCIIGTKIATRIFKDNDLVEVDANTGVVKKIH